MASCGLQVALEVLRGPKEVLEVLPQIQGPGLEALAARQLPSPPQALCGR